MKAVSARPRRCKAPGCEVRYKPRSTFDRGCSVACELICDRLERSRKMKREKQEGRERLKTLGQLCVDAQVPVNLFVRIRDHGKGCISCPDGSVQDAGHFFPVG